MTGRDKHDPQRYRGRAKEPQPVVGLREAPGYLDDIKRGIWDELCGQIALGVLTEQDTLAFEVLVNMVDEYRTNPARMSATKLMVLIGLIARFGMTPADRTRIKVVDGPDVKSNPFSEFSARAS